jgi:hypothetical protein
MGAFVGAFIGFWVGLFYGIKIWFLIRIRKPGAANDEAMAFIVCGAVYGVLGGLVLGACLAAARWRPVRIAALLLVAVVAVTSWVLFATAP